MVKEVNLKDKSRDKSRDKSKSNYKDKSQGNNKDNLRDDARLSLLKAGLELFGECGFKGASTRMIADEAQVNISAIAYYFGGKQELYYSVVEYILSQMIALSKELDFDLPKILNSEISKKDSLEVMNQVMDVMMKIFVESEEPRKWCRIIMREQANPTKAFDILYEGKIKKMQNLLAKIIVAYTGLNGDSDEVKIIAHTIYGQLIGFVVGRESIIRNLGVKKLAKNHLNIIRKTLQNNVEASLVLAKKDGGKR